MKHTSFFTCLGCAALVLMLLMGLSACSGEKYKVEYDYKGAYVNAKDYYRAGSKVVLYYDLIATDTDYSFLLDGEHIPFTYDEKKGYVIEFTCLHSSFTSCPGMTNSIIYPFFSS